MKPILTLLLGTLFSIAGCALPNSGYYGISPDQAEANRDFTAKLQRQDDDDANRNREAQAKATEVATRHNPSNVSTSTTAGYGPTF